MKLGFAAQPGSDGRAKVWGFRPYITLHSRVGGIAC